jgi:hypothetical protein
MDSTGLDNLWKEIWALRVELHHINDEEGDKSVEIGGLVFRNHDNLGAWLLENVPCRPFGAFVDSHRLLQQVHYGKGGNNLLQKLRNNMCLSMTGDVLALAAIRNPNPVVMGEGKTLTGDNRSSFHAFHSHVL